jgi:SpoIID/LytB domain protein
MSAWGAYGSAVNKAMSWRQILDYYYGGTANGGAANQSIGVRLMAMDNVAVTGVISTTGRAIWNGVAHGAVYAQHVGSNTYAVFASPTPACPGAAVAWTPLGRVKGPVTFTTDVNETSGAPGSVLGLCQAEGSVVHYRGSITALEDSAGQTHTVDRLLVENYVKGVMARELPSSWGNSARGMNALLAFAVAQRSFALSQNRYSYAKTCDTATCQVYGGSAYRVNPSAPTSWPGSRVCETGNPTFECASTNRAIADTAGVIRVWPNGSVVSTEYSASHGPYSAGGAFPVVDDSASNVPANPNYKWTRTVDAAALEVKYRLGNLTGAHSERQPSSTARGVWGNRVVLVGTKATVAVTDLDFRKAFGFPSHGFTIVAVNR